MVFVSLFSELSVISSLVVFQRGEYMSMYRFQTSGFKALLFKVYVSSLAMKIFANVTAVLVLIAVPGIYYPRNSE